jgi:hypothetical protein
MAGALTISTLNDSSGVLATQNGMTGIAKAWVYYNGSTQTVIGSFNVSSVTYVGIGQYTVNYTTAMPNANYSIITTATVSSGRINGLRASPTTTTAQVGYYDAGASAYNADAGQMMVTVFSS